MLANSIRMLGLVLLGTLVAACGGGGGGTGGGASPAASTGGVTLSLSDGVIEGYDQVLMEIQEVRFLSDGGQDIVVLDEPVTVDFLSLQNFSEVLLKRQVVTGTYSKIRLILGSLTLVKLDPATGAVLAEDPVPLNGLRKVDINPRGPFTVRGGEDLVIDIEIDLDKSIHVVAAGKSGKIRFRPVIFASIDTEPAFDKLFRVEGTIDSVDATAGTFRVCDIRRAFADGLNRPQPADVCVTVDPEDGTPYFDFESNPLADGFGSLLANDPVVVYGKFDAFATGDRLVPAVVAVGLDFEDSKGLAASEYRPALAEFDLGQANDTCVVDPDPLRVVVADGAPAFVETSTGADPVDLAALPLLCRRAEVEGFRDESVPEDPFLRSFIVLLGDSLVGSVEVVGILTDKTATADVTNDYDLDVADPGLDEVVVVTDATRLVKVTSGAGGDTVEDVATVPTGTPVTVYGVRREDGVIEASFVLEEVAAP